MLDKSKFINLMTGMCEVFNHKPSEFIYDVYYTCLKEFEYEEVAVAVNKVIATHKYNTLPKPADILSFLQETKEDLALGAWIQVKDAMFRHGYYETVEFKDKKIHSCIESLGGWMWLCSQKEEDMPFIEKRFVELYALFCKRQDTPPQRLLGYHETNNAGKGYVGYEPKTNKIGFSGKDRRVTALKKEC